MWGSAEPEAIHRAPVAPASLTSRFVRVRHLHARGPARRVGLSRSDQVHRVSSLEPQPTLESLRRLVSEMAVPTSLSIEGVERPLEAGVGLSAYRIVQEALTNVQRHSSAYSAAVTLRYLPESLEVEVADDGAGTAHAFGGNGLIGMRERAAMCGGSVELESAPGAGFRVGVSLPMTPAVA